MISPSFMMQLHTIISTLGSILTDSTLCTEEHNNISVSQIVSDSRKISPGALFVALVGTQTDGRKFIPSAIKQGATAVVLEGTPTENKAYPEVPFIYVTDANKALALLADAFYNHPSQDLCMVGVTGTNGKTTTTTLLYDLFTHLGYRCGLIGTVEIRIGEKRQEARYTTPDALELNKLLHQMRQDGCSHVFMEVSSHALAQQRVYGIDFKVALFTNLTRDHLDYHQTVANYLAAKKSLFDHLSPSSVAVVNKDDRNHGVMTQNSPAQVVTYALRSMATHKATILEQHLDGTSLLIDGTELQVQLTGAYNMYNLLAVYATTHILLPHLSPTELCVELSLLSHVNGRFDILSSSRGYHVVVDYAHTPDALKNVLETIEELAPRRIITVVGAGGNRDKGKRPEMGKIAALHSSQLILTSDNPRNEDPAQIIQEMATGVAAASAVGATAIEPPLEITSRKEAIKTACRLAQKGDVILIAGKGHETYQEIAGIRHHFDDKEVVTDIFQTEQ